MAKTKKGASELAPNSIQSLTLGEYAHAVVGEQYRSTVKYDKKVLGDTDPEHVHHMRVGTRRLRTALQVFDGAIELPKAANDRRIGKLARTLGQLRDLDVQLADLQTYYRPLLPKSEQAHLDEAVAALKHQRCGAFAAVEHALTRSRYQTLKTAVETWLEQPRYTSIATLPLFSLLPDLLSPLLSSLLLHPGWLVEAADTSEEANETLHDLRKACKHARYQAEFFAPFYNADFQTWTDEVKDIQATLGSVHDRQVLTDLLLEHQPKRGKLASLHTLIEQSNAADMADWDDRRQKYLSAEFRQSLRRLILDAVRSPSVPTPTNAMN